VIIFRFVWIGARVFCLVHAVSFSFSGRSLLLSRGMALPPLFVKEKSKLGVTGRITCFFEDWWYGDGRLSVFFLLLFLMFSSERI
jgi:hypothetical protein